MCPSRRFRAKNAREVTKNIPECHIVYWEFIFGLCFSSVHTPKPPSMHAALGKTCLHGVLNSLPPRIGTGLEWNCPLSEFGI